MTDSHKPKSWFGRLSGALNSEPRDRKELRNFLHEAEKSQVLNHEALMMIEGVLQVSEMQVRDVMVPRPHMVVIRQDLTLDKIISIVIESGHSRFPVVGETPDDVVGILLAKDLLRYSMGTDKPFFIQEVMRAPTFVPESKRLDSLLKELRDKHNHLAIVVDEYGGIAGLATIEDVIEEIVGEIEDEYDVESSNTQFIESLGEDEYMIKPILPIEDFNEFFGAKLSDEQFDTIGGLVLSQFGHLPHHGEETDIDIYHFTVMQSDKRRIQSLKMQIRR